MPQITDSSLSTDVLASITERLAKLEDEVLKSKSVKSESIVSPTPDLPTPAITWSTQSWSAVVTETMRRLDACASQQGMNECIVSMRKLKEDLGLLRHSLKESRMTPGDEEACKPFLHPSGAAAQAPPEVKQPRRDDSWRATPPHITRIWSKPPTTGRPSGDGSKKWGACFYCPCTEWKPGHTCEGSKAAELRRKERESRGS